MGFSCTYETKTKAVITEDKEIMDKYFHHRAAVLFEQNMPSLNGQQPMSAIPDNGDDHKEEEDEAEVKVAVNAVIKLNTYKKLGGHKKTMPCLIIAEKKTKKDKRVRIQLPAPFAKEKYWISPNEYDIVQVDERLISKTEREWAKYHGKALGYKSLEEKQKEFYANIGLFE